jgi:integrase
VVPIAPELLPLLRRLRASALDACKDQKVVDLQQQYVLGHGGAIRTGFENAVKRAGLEPPRPWEKETVQDGRKVVVKLREPTAAELEDYRRNSVTPHTLRHSRITHLLQDGVDPWDVAGLAGDTLDTILEVYGHHCPNHLAGVLKRRQADKDEMKEKGA